MVQVCSRKEDGQTKENKRFASNRIWLKVFCRILIAITVATCICDFVDDAHAHSDHRHAAWILAFGSLKNEVDFHISTGSWYNSTFGKLSASAAHVACMLFLLTKNFWQRGNPISSALNNNTEQPLTHVNAKVRATQTESRCSASQTQLATWWCCNKNQTNHSLLHEIPAKTNRPAHILPLL